MRVPTGRNLYFAPRETIVRKMSVVVITTTTTTMTDITDLEPEMGSEPRWWPALPHMYRLLTLLEVNGN